MIGRDKLSRERRSWNMSRIRGKDTAPELVVRSLLHRLGFRALRVRHYADTARIEVPIDDLLAVVERRTDVVIAVQSAGYRYVTLDLEGLRSGNLNPVVPR